MNLLSLLSNHTHYWGVPHERHADERLIQTCYGCGKERELKVELRPDHAVVERLAVRSEMGVLEHAQGR